MSAQIQGGVRFQDLKQDQGFLTAPLPEQIQYLQEDYLPKQDPDFAKAPKAEQQQYINEVVLPQLKPSSAINQLSAPAPRPSAPDPKLLNRAGAALGNVGLNYAELLKGASLGYLDATKPIEQFTQQQEQAAGLPEMPFRDQQRGLYNFAGQAVPWIVGGEVLGLGAAATAGRLAPLTTPLAEAAGVTQSWMRPALGAAQRLNGQGLGARTLRDGLVGLGVGAAENQPNDERLGSALSTGLMGAAFPPLAEVGGQVLKGGVKAVRNIFNPQEALNPITQGLKQETFKVLQYLDEVYTKLKRGEIDPALVTSDDYASLVAKLDEVNNAYRQGKVIKDMRGARQAGARIERKAAIRAKAQKRPVSVPQPEPVTPAVNSEPVPAAQTPEATKASPVKLTGSVKEMVKQSAQATGMQADELVNAKPKDLSPEQKDIRTNIIAVQKAEVLNEELGILRQQPVNEERQLLFGQVKEAVPEEYKGIAEKLNEAIEKDKAIRIEYQAEEVGRSNEAAKITAKGNVKVEPTTFTPTFWNQTKDGRVMVQGYNQRGHFVSYHLAPSESGSQVLKAGKLVDKPFRGEYPNRVYGQREFRAEDVLNRGARSADGAMKTSEAIQTLEGATANLDKIFSLINSGKISASANSTLMELQNAEKWGVKELKKFQMILKDRKLQTEVCALIGLTHK